MDITKNPEDTTEIALLFCNVSPEDVLLQKELEALAAAHSNFKVWFTGKAFLLTGAGLDPRP